MKYLSFFVALGFLAFNLSGCVSKKAEKSPCPPYAIIGDLSETFIPTGATGSPDIKAIIKIHDLQAECEGNFGKETVYFTLNLAAKPLDTIKEPITISYFIALVDQSDTILDRQDSEITIKFEGEVEPLMVEEKFSYDLNLMENKPLTNYRLLVGLVMTPDQLSANKQRKAAYEHQLLSIQTPQEVAALKVKKTPRT